VSLCVLGVSVVKLFEHKEIAETPSFEISDTTASRREVAKSDRLI
jgi:hypothetical protein